MFIKKVIYVAALLAVVGTFVGWTTSAGTHTYKLSTDWYFDPAFAPILLADQAGYFKQAGVDVSIHQGSPGDGGIQALAHGKIDFLYGALDALPYAVASNL